jgi:hypothetical protein
MSEALWTATINGFLGKLEATGRAGFEGLVSDLCEASTGQRFTLSGSGPQEGQDSRSESGYGNRIKVEAKHYTKSALNLRQLTAEIVQATSSGSGVDLWVLAASCAVTDRHVVALEGIANRQNTEILFLDLGNDGLPRMAVLMASFPQRVEDWIRRHEVPFQLADLRVALNELSTQPPFASARDQLQHKLRSTLLGYDDARERSKRRFLQAMRDQGDALAVFNQRVALRSDEVRRIRRVSLHDQLSSWWTNPSSGQKRAVVIGEEGTGKTWAAMDWVVDRIEAGVMPILLPFCGVAESIPAGETVEDFLPKLLAKWTGIGDPTSWVGRINRWFASPAPSGPLILLLADGLNERPTVHWPSFLRTLDEERWRKHVAVLATDRAGHWRPNCARAGLDGFQEISIGGYTDWELEQALQGKGIALNSIPHELEPLIRKPRYCELVCQHFDEMRNNADFTIERLILLDARHRSDLKRGAMTESEFIEVLRNLALYYRTSPTVQLSAIKSLLPCPDPDRRIHQEIIDSGLLVPRPGVGTGFTVERTRLVFGLGMLLCDEIRRAAQRGDGSAQIENDLASWFEPHPEMDLKVDTCGSALFHSLIDESYPASARRELLRYWLSLRNWGDKVQEAFIDYVHRCPEDFVAVAEEFWSSTRDLGAAQDFFRAAFTTHRDDPLVQPVLIPAISRWMAFVHPAGHPMLRHDAVREEKRRAEIQARVGYPLQTGPLNICGEQLTVIEDEALLRLSRFGFLIVSAGAVLPFIPALVRWAVAAAVMGHAMEGAVADWVVRLSDEPIDDPLLGAAQCLLVRQEPVAHVAADTLLSRIGTSSARRLQDEHPLPENEQWKRLREEHALDPCMSGFEWSEDDCLLCVKREDVPVHVIVSRVGDRLFDPDFHFPEPLVGRATDVLMIDPAKYRVSLSQTAEGHWLEQALPLLAARAPRSLANFIRRVVATIPGRSLKELYPLAVWLPEIALLCGPVEQGFIDLAMRSLTAVIAPSSEYAAGEPKAVIWRVAEALAFLATLPHRSPEGVFSALIDRPTEALDLDRFEPWFGPLPSDQVQTALELLHSAADDVTLVRTLWFMSVNKVPLSDADRDRICVLAESKNQTVRGVAMRFACLQEDAELGPRIVDNGRSYQANRHTYEGIWGTRLLVRFSDHLSFQSAATRLHPADAGYALDHRGHRADEARLYAMSLDRCLHEIVNAPHPELPSLPNIVATAGEGEFGDNRPRLTGEAEADIEMKNPSSTWTAGRPVPLPSQISFDPQTVADELTRRSQERANAIASAWRTPAMQWFGTSFSRSAMNEVCRQSPDMVKNWTDAALGEGPMGQTVRRRLATFLAALCPPLLERLPALGLKLWNTLRAEATGPARFDAVSCAFAACDNSATDEARWQILKDCHDDAAISKVAFIAELTGRKKWLQHAIGRMIAEVPLYKRAIGLTLASFSDVTAEQFGAYVVQANVQQTWVEGQIKWMRGNVLRNSFAEHWFQVFLASDDLDSSWGALQVMLRCADRRFYLWHDRYAALFGERAERKIKFLNANRNELEKALDREKERKDTFLGVRIERSEVFPFFDD